MNILQKVFQFYIKIIGVLNVKRCKNTMKRLKKELKLQYNETTKKRSIKTKKK